MPEEKKSTKTKGKSPSAEAEADARAMLLAGGTLPLPDRSAVEQLLAQMPQTEKETLTYGQFMVRYGMSRSTFFRQLREGLLPKVRLVAKANRAFSRTECDAWWAAQPEVPHRQAAAVAAAGEVQLPPRHLRVVKAKTTKPAEQVPRLFQAAPVKTGKKRGRPPRAARAEEPAEAEDSEAHAARTAFLYAHELGHYVQPGEFFTVAGLPCRLTNTLHHGRTGSH